MWIMKLIDDVLSLFRCIVILWFFKMWFLDWIILVRICLIWLILELYVMLIINLLWWIGLWEKLIIFLVIILLFGIMIILLFVVCMVVEKICIFSIVLVMLFRLIYFLVWNGWNMISNMLVVRLDSDFCKVRLIVKFVVLSIVMIDVVCIFMCFSVVISVKVIIL